MPMTAYSERCSFVGVVVAGHGIVEGDQKSVADEALEFLRSG
jgi:hypothetical protein